MNIPFHKIWFDEKEKKEIIDTLESGWITTGPRTQQFEKDFSDYIGIENAIGLNSCTAGLHLAFECIEEKCKNWEVIVPSITFAATANTVIHAGGIPVLCDVSFPKLLITAEEIEKKITDRTKAVVVVHLYGQPCNMDEIISLCKKYKLTLIEDCAHSIETLYKGKHTGTFGQMASFSFYATKNITTAEGGMFVTSNKEIADKVKVLRLHGMSKDAWKRYGNEGFKHYQIEYPGFKYNMSDIQAALGIIQLKKVDMFWKLRKEYTEYYNNIFKDIDEIITIPEPEENCKNAYHVYSIIIKTEKLKINRDKIMDELIKNGISCVVHFRALHLQPYYMKEFNYHKNMLKNSEYADERLLSLPLYPSMGENEENKYRKIEYCAEKLCSIIKKNRG